MKNQFLTLLSAILFGTSVMSMEGTQDTAECFSDDAYLEIIDNHLDVPACLALACVSKRLDVLCHIIIDAEFGCDLTKSFEYLDSSYKHFNRESREGATFGAKFKLLLQPKGQDFRMCIGEYNAAARAFSDGENTRVKCQISVPRIVRSGNFSACLLSKSTLLNGHSSAFEISVDQSENFRIIPIVNETPNQRVQRLNKLWDEFNGCKYKHELRAYMLEVAKESPFVDLTEVTELVFTVYSHTLNLEERCPNIEFYVRKRAPGSL